MGALGYFKYKLVIVLAACLPGSLAQSTTASPSPPYNETACCIEEHVTQECMGLCTFDLNVELIKNMTNPLSCVPDLRKLLACGAGGRNHTDCCFASGVKSRCLSFCSGSVPAVLDDSHMDCLDHLDPMLDCMKFGQDVLPSAPINVTAVLVSSDDGGQSMRVSWQVPSIHPDKVTYYLVQVEQRQVSGSLKHRTIRRVPSSTLNVTVAIQEAQLYLVNVVAANNFGKSHPSRTMLVKKDIPRPAVTTKPITPKDVDMSQCCMMNGMSRTDSCLAMCTLDFTLSDLAVLPNPIACLSKIGIMVTCAADGRNHSKCCSDHQVPYDCQSFCSGEANIRLQVVHLGCVQFFSQIIECVKTGRDQIPSKPTKVGLKFNSSTSRLVTVWSAPLLNPLLAKWYNMTVYYKAMYPKLVYNSTFQLPRGLKPLIWPQPVHKNGSYYVELVAGNDYGHSHRAMSNVIKVTNAKTHGIGNLLPPDTPDTLMHTGDVSSNLAVIVAVVVVVGILITIGVVVAGILVCRRLKMNRNVPKFEESVAFENPGYARQEEMRAQIQALQSAPTGLPGQPGSPTTNATIPATATAAAASNSSIMPELKPDEVPEEGLLATPGERKQEEANASANNNYRLLQNEAMLEHDYAMIHVQEEENGK